MSSSQRTARERPPQFTLRKHKRPREALLPVLWALELKVMDEVWRRGEVSVRKVHQAFDERHAYTTLMTTLDTRMTDFLVAASVSGVVRELARSRQSVSTAAAGRDGSGL